MALFCPFCSDEINPTVTECPSCLYTFSFHTRSFLDLSHKAQDTYPHENRKQVRFSMKLRVIAYKPEAFIHHYTSNLSLGGLFIKTNTTLSQGKGFDLKLFLFDAAGPMEVPCEVVWSRKEERLAPMGKLPRGIGVKFSDLSKMKNITRGERL